jgi:hypothetical protein
LNVLVVAVRHKPLAEEIEFTSEKFKSYPQVKLTNEKGVVSSVPICWTGHHNPAIHKHKTTHARFGRERSSYSVLLLEVVIFQHRIRDESQNSVVSFHLNF